VKSTVSTATETKRMLSGHEVTIESIVMCNPSYANQLVCLCLAGIVLEVLMSVIARSVAAFVRRSEQIKYNMLMEVTQGLKNEIHAPWIITAFDAWSKKKGIESSILMPTFEEFLKCGGGGDGDDDAKNNKKEWDSRDEAVDSYLKSDSRRNVWTDFAIDKEAGELAMSLQHLFSGTVALLAVTIATDRESFLTLARWSILLEAGWEAFDTVKNIIYPFITSRFNFASLLLMCHHVTLYMFLPLNRISLPGPIGYDITVLVIMLAGLPGLTSILGFIKKNVDSSTPKGRIVFLTTQVLITTTMVTTRGPCWVYFAFRILKSLWNDGTPWPIFLCYALAILMFSFFNLIVIHFCQKGLKSALKKFHQDYKVVEETKRPSMGKRPTMSRNLSIIDVLAQEANISGRISVRRSITLMGVDYELDDEEVKELDVQLSIRQMSSKNMSMRSSFFFSTLTDIKKD